MPNTTRVSTVNSAQGGTSKSNNLSPTVYRMFKNEYTDRTRINTYRYLTLNTVGKFNPKLQNDFNKKSPPCGRTLQPTPTTAQLKYWNKNLVNHVDDTVRGKNVQRSRNQISSRSAFAGIGDRQVGYINLDRLIQCWYRTAGQVS